MGVLGGIRLEDWLSETPGAGGTFELIRTHRIGETTLAPLALVDGRWYITEPTAIGR